ncbi:MAG: hypothetical protein HON55_01525 [Legionellales bacterium]|nr:hypothetical protein [Legionellales bacterium]
MKTASTDQQSYFAKTFSNGSSMYRLADSIKLKEYFHYSVLYAVIALSMHIFNSLHFFLFLGFPLFHANILLYSIASALSYLFIFGFCGEKDRDSGYMNITKKNLVFLLSSIVAATVTFYHIYPLVSTLAIPLPVIYGLVSLFVCQLGSLCHDYKSKYSPALISLLFPITCALPGLFQGNTLVYISFLCAYFISNYIKMAMMRYFDKDLTTLNSLYEKVKGNIDKFENRGQIKDVILKGISSKESININDDAIVLVSDKIIMEKELDKHGRNIFTEYLKTIRAQSDDINNYSDSSTDILKTLVANDFRKNIRNKSCGDTDSKVTYGPKSVSPSEDDYTQTVEIDRSDDDLKLSDKFKYFVRYSNLSYDSIMDLDFADTRQYSHIQTKNQNNFDIMAALVMLLLGTLATNFYIVFPTPLPAFNGVLVLFVLCATLVFTVINLIAFYINRTKNVSIDSGVSKVSHAWFGIDFKATTVNEVNDDNYSFFFNVYFVAICFVFIIFMMQYNLYDMYLMRFEDFISWGEFFPQIILFDISVLFPLCFHIDDYKVSFNAKAFIFTAILYGGVAINLLCPAALFLFSQTPTLVIYVFMSVITIGVTSIANMLTYDGETGGLASRWSSLVLPFSPYHSPVEAYRGHRVETNPGNEVLAQDRDRAREVEKLHPGAPNL